MSTYTINIAPTWGSQIHNLVESAAKQYRQMERGTLKENDAWAVQELHRLAAFADDHNESVKAK